MLSQRIKQSRKSAGLRQEDIATAMGIAIDTVRRWENGKAIPSLEQACTFAKLVGVSVSYLAGETVEAQHDGIQLLKDQVLVAVYKNIEPHCGQGTDQSEVQGELEQFLPLSAATIGTSNSQKVYGLRVEGRSMENAGIPDGSIAIIRSCDDWFVPQWGDPCYVQYQRDGFFVDAIKFFYPKRDGSEIVLKSAEGSGIQELHFERDEVSSGNPNILGVVVGVVELNKPQKGR